MKVRIREGNDFDVVWAIKRAGLPEDLSSAINMRLTLVVYGTTIEHNLFTVTDNVLSINIPKEVATIKGDYRLVFEYTLPDAGQPDGDLKCKTDVVPFRIVPFTADADDVYTVNTSSDIAFGFKGDKGDDGDDAYQIWLDLGNEGTYEDFIAYLRQPAVDAGASISELEGEIQVSEGLRVQAESERDLRETTRIQAENERLSAEIIRQSNEDNRIENESTRVQNEAERISKEGIRQSSETDRVEAEGIRQSNEIDRIEAESERVQAESERQITIQEAVTATNLANEKANLANTAAQSANEAALEAQTATQEATTAASLADTARLAIEGELALKANQTELDQLAGEVSVNIKNEISNGSFEGTISGWVPASFNTPRTEFAKSGQQSAGIVFAGGSPTTQYGYTEVQTTIGDVYYAKAWAYIITFSSNQYLRKSNGGGFSGSITANFNINLLNQWQPVSLMFNAETSYTRIILGNTSTTTDAVRIYYDDVQLFNLSSVFGYGNEPTLEEFELLHQMMGVEYFEGEITIQQRYLMQWQLALIRKNKNAIIALGGTII